MHAIYHLSWYNFENNVSECYDMLTMAMQVNVDSLLLVT